MASAIGVEEKRRQGEEALRESEERFRTLYEKSTVGLYRTTREGKLVLANPALLKMLGYSSLDEFVLRSQGEGGFAPVYGRKRLYNRVKEAGDIHDIVSIWIRSDGSIVFVSESVHAIRNTILECRRWVVKSYIEK
jgi:PAS domain S-box-containing protein